MSPIPAIPPRPNPRNRTIDAFFWDEWLRDPSGVLVMNPSTHCHINQFKDKTASLQMNNPLDSSVRSGLPANEEIPPEHQGERDYYYIFIPDKLRRTFSERSDPLAKISLYFGPGDEINRHGLRHFFEDKKDRVLITIPGIEDYTPNWGVGISSQQINELFTAAGVGGIRWEVRIIAAFSTGYRGMNGTINNRLVPLDKIDTVIFYDCLYRGDEPRPGNRTNQALSLLRTSSPGINIITYEVTPGGTPRDNGNHLRANVPTNSISSFEGSGLINLKNPQQIISLRALNYARVLGNGIDDQYFARSEVPRPILDLIDNLPYRGTVASSPGRGHFGRKDLDRWANENRDAIRGITSEVIDKAGQLIVGPDPRNPKSRPYHHLLVGWPVKWPNCPPKEDPNCQKTKPSIDVGDLIHDLIDVEFGWEFLAGPQDPP